MKNHDTTPLLPEDSATQSAAVASGHTTAAAANKAGLAPAVQKHIGNLLRVSYQDLLTEPVPDRFANLLEQLEAAEKKAK